MSDKSNVNVPVLLSAPLTFTVDRVEMPKADLNVRKPALFRFAPTFNLSCKPAMFTLPPALLSKSPLEVIVSLSPRVSELPKIWMIPLLVTDAEVRVSPLPLINSPPAALLNAPATVTAP